MQQSEHSTTPISSEELAYIAGFFDGEGCVRIEKKRQRYQPLYAMRVSVEQVDKAILDKLSELFGGSVRLVNLAHGNVQEKWRWQLSGTKAQQSLAQILPYLRQKKQQAEVAIAFQNRRQKRGCGPLSDEERARDEADYLCIRRMKKEQSKPSEQRRLLSYEEEMSYVSGFFDGEGCVWIQRNRGDTNKPRYTMRVSVEQVDKDILDHLCGLFGGSLRSYTRANDNWQTTWQWVVGATSAKEFLEVVVPYLRQKKEQAEIAIAFQNRRQKHGGRPLSDDERARDEHDYWLMRNLKRPGNDITLGPDGP